MSLTMALSPILAALESADYGAPATYDLGNGRELALTVEIDHDASVRDYDVYGEFSDYAYDYTSASGRDRPDGMNGNAEKIQVDRGSFVWWQPPADGPKRGTEEFREFRQLVRDLLESGYVGYVLELREGTDAMGRPIALNVASLWGIDARPDSEYGREIVRELIAEVLQ